MDILPGSPLSTNKSSCGCYYNQFEVQKNIRPLIPNRPYGGLSCQQACGLAVLSRKVGGSRDLVGKCRPGPKVYTSKRFHLALNCKTNKPSSCSSWGPKWVRFAHKEREKGPPSRNPCPLWRIQVALCEFPAFLAQVRASWTSSCTRCVHYNTEWSLSNSEVLT